jgi:two-component system response regulator
MSRPMRILWIDDDPAETKIMKYAAEEQKDKCVFRWAGSAAEGLEALNSAGAEESADLVLLDIKMPAVDGFEVLRRIRADHRAKRTVVVMYSTSSRAEDVLRSYELGANSYAVKPTGLAEACAFLRKLCAYWTGEIVLPTRVIYG